MHQLTPSLTLEINEEAASCQNKILHPRKMRNHPHADLWYATCTVPVGHLCHPVCWVFDLIDRHLDVAKGRKKRVSKGVGARRVVSERKSGSNALNKEIKAGKVAWIAAIIFAYPLCAHHWVRSALRISIVHQ